MKIYKIGVAVIVVNDKGEFLLHHRDNNPRIKYPGTWVLFGGGVHKNEKPENTLVREIREELNLDIHPFTFYKNFKYEDAEEEHLQYVFFKRWDLDIDTVTLNEGMGFGYFGWEKIGLLELGFNIRSILDDFHLNSKIS